jgi:hypothetical protein
MRRTITTLALACSAALVLAVTTVQARPTVATTTTVSSCKIVITGASWSIRTAGGTVAGNRYTLAGEGMSCASARTWATKFTHQQGTSPIKGPAGFNCRSFSTAASGDKLLYSGACMRPPHNIPFFEWAPKLPRS